MLIVKSNQKFRCHLITLKWNINLPIKNCRPLTFSLLFFVLIRSFAFAKLSFDAFKTKKKNVQRQKRAVNEHEYERNAWVRLTYKRMNKLTLFNCFYRRVHASFAWLLWRRKQKWRTMADKVQKRNAVWTINEKQANSMACILDYRLGRSIADRKCTFLRFIIVVVEHCHCFMRCHRMHWIDSASHQTQYNLFHFRSARKRFLVYRMY